MEKFITFSVPIKKKCDNGKTIAYKLSFIDSFRFMPTSLSEQKLCTENNRCEKCKKIIEGLIKRFSSIYQFCKLIYFAAAKRCLPQGIYG